MPTRQGQMVVKQITFDDYTSSVGSPRPNMAFGEMFLLEFDDHNGMPMLLSDRIFKDTKTKLYKWNEGASGLATHSTNYQLWVSFRDPSQAMLFKLSWC